MFDEKIRLLDKPAKVLFLIPFIPLLNAVKINYRYLVGSFIAGSFFLLLSAGYDRYVLNYARAGTDINAIQFGAIAIAVASTALALVTTYQKSKPLYFALLICLASGGLWAGLMSQSKGSIIAIPIASFLICLLYFYKQKFCLIKATVWPLIFLALCFTAVYDSPIKERFQRSVDNTIAFNQGSKTNTSSGIRIGQWKLALEAGQQFPILGMGKSAFTKYKNEQVLAGRFGQELLKYDNSHNAFANAFARRGLVGLLSVILFLGFPIYLGIQTWRKAPNGIAPYSFALASFGCVFFISNITQEIIYLNTGIIMYTGLLVILTSMLAERIKAHEPDPPKEQLSSNQ